jgi:hypothetical protein
MANTKTSRTISYTDKLTSTREALYKGGVPQDAIFNAIPTLEALRTKGGFKESADGGEVIRINVINEKNSTGKSYAGHEAANLAPQDEFTIAYDNWRQMSWSTTISGIDKAKNGGSARIFDLLKQKEEVTYLSATEDVNAALWDVAGITQSTGVTSNGGKAINSIPLIIQKAPGTSNVVHGITASSTANTWWLNRIKAMGATQVGRTYMDNIRTLINTCNRGRGGGAVDLLVFDQVSYEMMESQLDTKVQYMNTDKASVGFKSLNWKGVDCIWDVYVPDMETPGNGGPDTTLTKGSVFALNSKCLHFNVMKGYDFSPTPFVPGTVNGQDNLISLTLLYAQLTTNSRRNLGLGYNIALSLTS